MASIKREMENEDGIGEVNGGGDDAPGDGVACRLKDYKNTLTLLWKYIFLRCECGVGSSNSNIKSP